MHYLQEWWDNDLSKWVKFVFLVLLANGLPAFIILISVPHLTETLFVWTINPPVSARLVGVMYSNAIMLVAFGIFQRTWANVRVIMVVITLFSIMATLLTFVYLKPFLAHPWFHLAYWLTMYLILFFAAPYVFYTHERRYGGKLPINLPLNLLARIVLIGSAFVSLIMGIGFLFRIETVNQFWPWQVAPLVGGLIGVLYITHTAAYLWALWDGDWIRVRPIFWQAPITNLLLIIITIIHTPDIDPAMHGRLLAIQLLAGGFVLVHGAVIFMYRQQEKMIGPVS